VVTWVKSQGPPLMNSLRLFSLPYCFLKAETRPLYSSSSGIISQRGSFFLLQSPRLESLSSLSLCRWSALALLRRPHFTSPSLYPFFFFRLRGLVFCVVAPPRITPLVLPLLLSFFFCDYLSPFLLEIPPPKRHTQGPPTPDTTRGLRVSPPP